MRHATTILLGLLMGTIGWGAAPSQAQETEITFRQEVRITGATVLRGGPASPPAVYARQLEGNVVGMRGDTLLFETGNEPVYWIPLASGFPLVERRAVVNDVTRSMLVAAGIGGAAGATFGWGFHEECLRYDGLGGLGVTCRDTGTAANAALEGFLVGAGIGAVAGLALSRFAKRSRWLPIPVQDIRYVESPVGRALSVRFPAGGRPGTP